MTLEFRIFGPPALLSEGKPVRLHSAKATALLAYLACEQSAVHSREKLAELLWGDAPEVQARHSLRQALYSLRSALGDVSNLVLHEGSGVVRFEISGALGVDLLDFRRLAGSPVEDIEGLRQAARLYRGILLEGLHIAGCPSFDEWLALERSHLEQQATRLMQRLMDALIGMRAYQEALDLGERLVGMDNLDEGTHRRLMLVYGGLEDRAAVQRQYRRCREILHSEMGAEPDHETRALYEQLLSRLPKLTAVRAAHRSTVPDWQGLFVGREAELAVLHAEMEQALAGSCRLVLLDGESGIGKTQLIGEFLRRSTGRHPELRWLRGSCYEAESRAPYAMWADALAPLAAASWQQPLAGLPEPWRRQLGRLVAGLASPIDDILGATVEESRMRLLQGVVYALRHLTQACPMVLAFDDLHWADDSSLELLHYAMRHLTGRRLLVVGAYRAEAVVDSPGLQAILNAGQHSVLRIAPMDEETITQLLTQLSSPTPPGLARHLHAGCGGNPLVIVETLRTQIEAGTLGEVAGTGALPVPQRVQDLVRARAAALRDEERRLLAAAAVIGRPCSLALLSRVTGQPELELLIPLERLIQRAFLRERDALTEETIDFYHEYVRKTLYEGLTRSERRVLHGRAAEALAAWPGSGPEMLIEEAAHHFEQAGDLRAIDYLVRTAEQAQRLYALAHAAAQYSRALALQDAHPPYDLSRRFDLLLAREAVLDRLGRRSEQRTDVDALLALAPTLSDIPRMAQAHLREAGFLGYSGRLAEAQQAGERALTLYRDADDRHGEAQALRELGFLHWSNGNSGAALAYNRSALQLHRQLGDIEGEATALHNLAEIYRDLNGPRQALAHYEQALSLEWARQDHRRQGMTFYGMAHARRQLDDRTGALSNYLQALAETQKADDKLMASRVHHAVASLCAENEELPQAIAHMQQALDISRSIGHGSGIAHSSASLAYLYAQQSDIDGARRQLSDALTWFHLMEDEGGMQMIAAGLQALNRGGRGKLDIPASAGWIKSHVPLAEGKIYCEFESPLAGQKNAEQPHPTPR